MPNNEKSALIPGKSEGAKQKDGTAPKHLVVFDFLVKALMPPVVRVFRGVEERRPGGPESGGYDRIVSRRLDCLTFLIESEREVGR